MSYDPGRDYIHIKDRVILHSTARRDWVCGQCGGRLTTRFTETAPHWQTVCFTAASHDPDTFVRRTTWEYLEARRQAESIEAGEVFNYLPAKLQRAIISQRGRHG